MNDTIKGSKIPHLVDSQFYNMEFDQEEVEEMQAIHDTGPQNLKFSQKKEAKVREMFSQAIKEREVEVRKPLSLRLQISDINWLKTLAKREWMPYQTLIASILHKVATGQIKI